MKIAGCLAVLAVAAASGGCRAANWTEAIPVMEEAPRARDLLAYPADGKAAAVNPPGFCWTPNGRAKAYRVEVREAGKTSGTALASPPQTSTVFPPYRKLAPGEYVWQVVYLADAGQPFGRSQTRRFSLPAGAPELLMPDVAALRDKLGTVRPRMFLSGGRLQELRDAVAHGAVPSWPRLCEAADSALSEPLYPEPEPYRRGVSPDEEWLRTFTPGKAGSAHLARTALAWRLTGDRKYLEGARRWMLQLASWDPKGITSHGLAFSGGRGNDEASMPMLERMSFAWDWMGGELTAEERAKVLASVTERGNQVLRKLRSQDFLSHPFDNHSGRAIAFLGDAGLAFLGDLPEAADWLDYALRCYLTSYPGWGGDEGGWSQGMSYWGFYVYGHTNFLEALRAATGTDVFRRPFYRNTGYLAVYFQPPYAPMGAFGDGGYHPPGEVEGMLTDCLAEVNRDPILKWQAQGVLTQGEKNTTRWREWFTEDVLAVLREGRPNATRPEPPSRLEGARYLPDIGWAAMHSALGDPANDVWVLFKSSRFGSYSHSHADQNTFQLYAYGRALAIDSGYYPSYGTPHDNLWTRQTQAHNGILIDGRGQPPFVWEAGGRIESFERRGVVTLVKGEAAGAYNLPQIPEVAKLWEQRLRQPLPPMTPQLEAFERTLAFAAAPGRPVLVVHDYLRASAPATFDWLLHALSRMNVDARGGAITVQDGPARLAVRLVAGSPLRFEQKSGFPVPPEPITNTAYVLGKEEFAEQWHLSARTASPAREMKFLAVLVPYRASEKPPEIVATRKGDAVGFRIGATEVSAGWGAGDRSFNVTVR